MPTLPTIHVRRNNDVSLVKRLDAKVFSKKDVKIKLEDTVWWVAWCGSKPVAFAGLRPLPHEPYTYFTRAGVLWEARGQGIHRKLIRARLAWTRRHGYAGAMTYTVSDNYSSANNLIRLGFELFEPTWKWAGGGCLYFFRALEPSPTS